ncbi:MAG TPA: ABC transporter permease subunit [Symbiobacteriaceae bacterium]|jgi:putative spermidine/putrescine transport system permease protein
MHRQQRTPALAWVVFAVILLYLLVPIVGTALYSVAVRWDSSLLPQGFTLAHYQALFSDLKAVNAMWRAVVVSVVTVVLLWLIVTPAVVAAHLYLPGMKRVLEIASIVPYAFPPVILAIGLIQLYSKPPLPISGTPTILVLAYGVICLPYMVGAIGNSLQAIDGHTLMEACESLGATRWTAYRLVILPNIAPGLVSSGLLTFAVALGEFVLANMLVGARFETIQIRLVQLMRFNGHVASALVMFYFALVAVASLALLVGTRRYTDTVRGE